MTGIAFDLFCGAGGASIGLHDAGFRVIGWDAWERAVATHRAAGFPTRLVDLSRVGAAYWHRVAAKYGRPSFVWASPPCQPFSSAGDEMGEDDDRDGIPWTLTALGALRPPVLAIENVRGLSFAKHRATLARLTTGLIRLGYRDVRWRIVDPADYGVPQHRPRLIVGAVLNGLWKWPNTTHRGRFVSMADALGFDPTDAVNTGRAWKLGGTRDDAQTVSAECPAPTVTTMSAGQWQLIPGSHACQAAVVPGRVSLEQLARLQDFPSGHPFVGGKADVARQIGNAVPPTLARVIAEANQVKVTS